MIKMCCDMCGKEIEIVEGTPKEAIQPVGAFLLREPQHEKTASMIVEICPDCYKIVQARFRRLFAAPEES